MKCLWHQISANNNNNNNAVDCEWDAWGSWGSCSATCGGGTKSRSRSQAQQAANGGAACTGSSSKTKACNQNACPGMKKTTNYIFCKINIFFRAQVIMSLLSPLAVAVDCVWNNWGAWGSCSASCGGGTQSRSRTVGTQPQNGGAACQGSSDQSQSCNDQSCPSMMGET